MLLLQGGLNHTVLRFLGFFFFLGLGLYFISNLYPLFFSPVWYKDFTSLNTSSEQELLLYFVLIISGRDNYSFLRFMRTLLRDRDFKVYIFFKFYYCYLRLNLDYSEML